MSIDPQTAQARLGITPSQTIGPFFAYALTPRAYGGIYSFGEAFETDLVRVGQLGPREGVVGMHRRISDVALEASGRDSGPRNMHAGHKEAQHPELTVRHKLDVVCCDSRWRLH